MNTTHAHLFDFLIGNLECFIFYIYLFIALLLIIDTENQFTNVLIQKQYK